MTIDTSSINPLLPQDSDLQTQDVRDNFDAIKTALDSASTQIDAIPGVYLAKGSNLSDLVSTDTALTNIGFSAYAKTLIDDSTAFQATGTLKAGYVVATKAEAAALTLTSADAGRKIFITSDDGGEFTVEYNATPSTYADDGGSYCGTQFIPSGGDGTIGIVRDNIDYITPEMFGAIGDGSTDDYTAINNAVNTGLPILWISQYYVASTVKIITSGQKISGTSKNSTGLIGALSLTPVLQIGDASDVLNVTLEDFRVTRESGTIPDNSVGILWNLWGYGSESKVISDRHGFPWHYKGPAASTAIGHKAYDLHAYSGKQAFVKVENVADLYWIGCECGKNGGDAHAPGSCLIITGDANALNFTDCDFIPRHASASTTTTVVSFNSYTNSTGVINFNNCNSENVLTSIDSDSGTTTIPDLKIFGGRWAGATNMFLLNAATSTSGLILNGPNIVGATSLTNPKWLRINNTTFSNGLTLIGGANASGEVVGNILLSGNLTTSGAWNNLVLSNIELESGSFNDTATGTLDIYDPLVKTATPTVKFVTNGDFSPTYNVQTCRYFRIGKKISFFIEIDFDTNAYTTASGAFSITHGMKTATQVTPVNIGLVDNASFSTTTLTFAEIQATEIYFRLLNSGAASSNWNTTNIPASTSNIKMRISGEYEY